MTRALLSAATFLTVSIPTLALMGKVVRQVLA